MQETRLLKNIYIRAFDDNICGSENYIKALGYSEIINKPIFTFKDASKQSNEITYRKLNDWDNKGLVESQRKGDKKGWRKFSIKDIIRLRIIKDLKLYGLSDVKITKVLEDIFEDDAEKKQYFFEYHFFESFLGNQKILLIVGNDGDACLFSEMTFATLLAANLNEDKPILILPFYDYVRPLIKPLLKKECDFDEKSTIWDLINNSPDAKVRMILEFINNENYFEILIEKKSDSFVFKPRSKNNNISETELMEIIKESDFQNITLNRSNGKIISLTREEVEKVAI